MTQAQFESDLSELEGKTETFELFMNKFERFYDDGMPVIYQREKPDRLREFSCISLRDIINTEDSLRFLTTIPDSPTEIEKFQALWIVAFNYLIAYASWINESNEKWSYQTLLERSKRLQANSKKEYTKLLDRLEVNDFRQSELRKKLIEISMKNRQIQLLENSDVVERFSSTSQDWYTKRYICRMKEFEFPVESNAKHLDSNNLFNNILTVFRQTSSSSKSKVNASKQSGNETGSKRGREDDLVKSSEVSKVTKRNNRTVIHSDNEEEGRMEIEVCTANKKATASVDSIALDKTESRVVATNPDPTLIDAPNAKGPACEDSKIVAVTTTNINHVDEEEEFTGGEESALKDGSKMVATHYDAAVETLTQFAYSHWPSGQSTSIVPQGQSTSIVPQHPNSLNSDFRGFLIELLKEQHHLKQKEFVVSMELVMRYASYQQGFSKFFIMCESLPLAFADSYEPTVENSRENEHKQKLIKSAEIYLNRLATNLFKFFKEYRIAITKKTNVKDALVKIFPVITSSEMEKYVAVLNNPNVRLLIDNLTMEDEMFVEFANMHDFKTYRIYLVTHLVQLTCKHEFDAINSHAMKDSIIEILRNIKKYKPDVEEKLVKKVSRVLETCMDNRNVLELRNVPTRVTDLHSRVTDLRSSTTQSSISYKNMGGGGNGGKSSRNVGGVKDGGSGGSSTTKATRGNASERRVQSLPDSTSRCTASSSLLSTIQVNEITTDEHADGPVSPSSQTEDNAQLLYNTPSSAMSDFLKTNIDVSPADREQGKALARYLMEAALNVCAKCNIEVGEIIHSSEILVQREIPDKILEFWHVYRESSDTKDDAGMMISNDLENKCMVKELLPMELETSASSVICLGDVNANNGETSLTTETVTGHKESAIKEKFTFVEPTATANVAWLNDDIENNMQKATATAFKGHEVTVLSEGSKFVEPSATSSEPCFEKGHVNITKPTFSSSFLSDDIIEEHEVNATATAFKGHEVTVLSEGSKFVEPSATASEPCLEEGHVNMAQPAVLSSFLPDNKKDEHEVNEVTNTSSSSLKIVASETKANIFKAADQLVKRTVTIPPNQMNAKVDIVSKIVLTDKCSNQYQACVLSVYIHAARIHLMTQHKFLENSVYKTLMTPAYQQHIKLLLAEKQTVDAMGLKTFSGERSLTNILRCLSPDVNFTKIQMFLPFKVDAFNAADMTLFHLNKMISDAINEESTQDLSMIFIDIKPLDIFKGHPRNCDFPNRVFANLVEKSSGTTVVCGYQTVGAVYKSIADGKDMYAFRILSRARCGGNFYLQEYFSDTKEDIIKTQPNLSYLYVNEDTHKLVVEHPGNKKSQISNSMFPAEIESSSNKGKHKRTYYIEGAILCLNEGQSEGWKYFPPQQRKGVEWNNIQNAMSLLEPITSNNKYTILLRDFRNLEPPSTTYLTDDILIASTTVFVQMAQLPLDRLCFFMPFIFRALLELLYGSCGGDVSADVWNEIFQSGYDTSRNLWEYENIFAHRKWYFTFVNYPDNIHWIFIGLHSGQRSFFIYDPHYDKNHNAIVTRTIQSYIDLEANTYATSENLDAQSRTALKSEQWQKIDCKAQQQPDLVNCGVMVLIGFFRAVVLLNGDASVSPEMMAKTWSCNTTVVRMREYRLQLSKLLSEGEVSASAFVFFSETLMGEVMSQNLDAQESKQQGGLRNRKSNN